MYYQRGMEDFESSGCCLMLRIDADACLAIGDTHKRPDLTRSDMLYPPQSIHTPYVLALRHRLARVIEFDNG